LLCGTDHRAQPLRAYINVDVPDILDSAKAVAWALHQEHKGVGRWVEDADLRPAMVSELQAKGFRTSEIRSLPTGVRSHPFDIVWNRDGAVGAIELKLKSRTAPVDDARLYFWYDIKWLELGIEAGQFAHGTAILLTDLRSLYEESGRGDWRHDYYRIGHRNAHRCNGNEPDHLFDRKYKPQTQFLSELFPLRIRGCYDFRSLWHVVSAGTSPLYLLAVPVSGPSAA